MSKKYRSDAMAGLNDAGAIEKQTMRRFDEDCLTAIRPLQVKLERGAGEAERGEFLDGDAVFEELRKMIDERRRSEGGGR